MTAVATEVVVGLDLGTTTSKALVRDLLGSPAVLVEVKTPWRSAGGGTQTTALAMVELAVELLGRAMLAAEQRMGRVQVLAVGVTGLAESGVLLDAAGESCGPVIAWYDQRGAREVAQVGRRSAILPEQFSRRTGLPFDSQCSLAKLLWLQSTGVLLTSAHRWASIPEWVVHGLGGRLVTEPSLASRTGLVDQSTGSVWHEGALAAGVPPTLLSPRVCGGEPAGSVRHPGLPASLQGATLTVAGHDHPVAAIGVGAIGADELFNSSGTADVVARSVTGALDDDRRALLVRSGLSAGAHVLPGTTLLLGGVRGGLLLRRVLEALGATGTPERNQLDQATLAVHELPAGLEVSGAGPTGDDVMLRMRDDATPAAIWAAATRYTASQTRSLVATIDTVVGPHRRAVACGGWTRMESVRAAKRSAIPLLQFSTLSEPGVAGAALLAEQALGVGPVGVMPIGPRLHPSSICEGDP